MSDFSELGKSELYFSSKVIGQIRPSLDAGIPLPNLAHLLIFSEEQIELGCKILRDRFNLNQHQQELLKFIQFVLNLHRTNVDYKSMWEANGKPTGPLFVFVLSSAVTNLSFTDVNSHHFGTFLSPFSLSNFLHVLNVQRFLGFILL